MTLHFLDSVLDSGLISPSAEKEYSFIWEGTITENPGDYDWDLSIPDAAAAQRVLPLDLPPGSDYLSAWGESKNPLDWNGMRERSTEALLAGSPSYFQEYRCFNHYGEVQWIREEVHLESLGPGRWKAQGICTDMTDQRRLESALSRSEAYFRRLFDHSVDALFVHDTEGRILDANRKACESLGYSHGELLTLRIWDYEVEVDPQRINQNLIRLLDSEEMMVQGVHQRKDGSTFPVEVQLGLLEKGFHSLILACVRDISERCQAEEALRKSEQTLRSFFDTPQIMMGIVEVCGDELVIVEANQASADFFGSTPAAIQGRKASEMGVPAEIYQQWLTHCRECAMKGEATHFDYERNTSRGNSCLWVSLSPIGKATSRYAYVVQDITQIKQAEADLKASEFRFRQSIYNAPIGKALVSLDGFFMDANPALCKIVGYTEEEFRFLMFQKISHPEDLDDDLDNMARLLAGSTSSYQMEKRYIHKRGHLVWILLSVSLVRDEDGQPLYFISQFQDITRQKRQEEELKRLNEELYQTARQDHLTGLRNRLQLQEDLEMLQSQARRYGHSFSVAMCDLDFFKAYNDYYGHLAGDRVLQRVGEALRLQCRTGDIAYRYGGEEFLLIFPEQMLEAANAAMERIRQSIEALSIPHLGNAVSGVVTISGGIACIAAGETKTIDQFLQEADEALYRCKLSGRNRISA